jgi:hypothetical protein
MHTMMRPVFQRRQGRMAAMLRRLIGMSDTSCLGVYGQSMGFGSAGHANNIQE